MVTIIIKLKTITKPYRKNRRLANSTGTGFKKRIKRRYESWTVLLHEMHSLQ